MRLCLRRALFPTLVAGMLSASTVFAAPLPLLLFHEDFEAGLGPQWLECGFPSIARKNVFSIAVEPGGNHYLRSRSEVESADSYSAKGIYMKFSARRCPEVTSRWTVSDVVATADVTPKEGDDGAAKVYVVFAGPSWWNPADERIVLYVWDNAAPVGAVLPNAWLPAKERMVVLESGAAKVGRWVKERVNLVEDFSRAFPGEAPSSVAGLAFLADTDNTHARVSAGFDDLAIRGAAPEEKGAAR